MHDLKATAIVVASWFVVPLIGSWLTADQPALPLPENVPGLLQAGAAAQSAPEPAIIVDGRITDMHDGDTVTVAVTTYYHIRLLDCWAPEVTGREKSLGLESKAHMQDLITRHGDAVRVYMLNSPQDWDNLTFGRRLGTIWPVESAEDSVPSYNQMMVRDNYAATTKKDLANLVRRWRTLHATPDATSCGQ